MPPCSGRGTTRSPSAVSVAVAAEPGQLGRAAPRSRSVSWPRMCAIPRNVDGGAGQRGQRDQHRHQLGAVGQVGVQAVQPVAGGDGQAAVVEQAGRAHRGAAAPAAGRPAGASGAASPAPGPGRRSPPRRRRTGPRWTGPARTVSSPPRSGPARDGPLATVRVGDHVGAGRRAACARSSRSAARSAPGRTPVCRSTRPCSYRGADSSSPETNWLDADASISAVPPLQPAACRARSAAARRGRRRRCRRRAARRPVDQRGQRALAGPAGRRRSATGPSASAATGGTNRCTVPARPTSMLPPPRSGAGRDHPVVAVVGDVDAQRRAARRPSAWCPGPAAGARSRVGPSASAASTSAAVGHRLRAGDAAPPRPPERWPRGRGPGCASRRTSCRTMRTVGACAVGTSRSAARTTSPRSSRRRTPLGRAAAPGLQRRADRPGPGRR